MRRVVAALWPVWVMIGFGILGLVMERHRLPLAPFVIGFVLGPIAEEKLSAGLMASNGSFLPIVTRPISALFFGIAILMLLLPFLHRWRTARKGGEA